ncbi:MAG: dihydrodipicolinate synthase family protein [Rhizobiaceae bacterium]|nr:MAG: dihydrodipicolinate synthase family protein [Rhizobiaceae bacterium]
MKTTPVTKADLERSVLAVPPLARKADLALDVEANRALIRYLQDGGVSTIMYGGNANFYSLGVFDYAETVESIAGLVAENTWVIPSIGPDFGKAMDQAKILRNLTFPTCMILPLAFPATAAGAARGVAKVVERFGKPLIAYLKAENYLEPEDIKSLVQDGLLCGIKYAVVRKDPLADHYLDRLIELVGTDIVISGIGERPAIDHLRHFGLAGFTSGSVCVAPRLATGLLTALKQGDYEEAMMIRKAFLPLEDLRDAFSPMRVLHEAVTLAGIADMGPMLPMLSNIDSPAQIKAISTIARHLRKRDAEFATVRDAPAARAVAL